MLIAEDLLLLLTDPAEGRLLLGKDKVRLVLAGALLVELEAAGRVTVEDRGRVAILDPRPGGDDLLDGALSVLTRQAGRKPKSALPKVAKGLPDAAYARLSARQEVAREEGRVLGTFPRVRHRVVGPRRQQVLGRTADVLLGRTAPDLRTGALLALLNAGGGVPKVFSGAGGLPGRELRARAKEIQAGGWASEAVRKAISDAEAAVLAASTVAVVAGSS